MRKCKEMKFGVNFTQDILNGNNCLLKEMKKVTYYHNRETLDECFKEAPLTTKVPEHAGPVLL